jgi:hypothetical protein
MRSVLVTNDPVVGSGTAEIRPMTLGDAVGVAAVVDAGLAQFDHRAGREPQTRSDEQR